MENEETVPVETLETPEEVEVTPEETPIETVDERDTRIAELEEKNKKLFERAKKAEEAKKAEDRRPTSGLSSADLLAVTNAKVHEDDIEKVERYAKSEGMSIKDALHDPELRAILDLRTEQRRSADAANINNVRAGMVAITDDVLLANAAKGKLPENDYEIERLIQAKVKEAQG